MAMAVDQIIVGIRAVSKLHMVFKLVYCKARPLGWAQHYEYYKPPNYNQFHTPPPPPPPTQSRNELLSAKNTFVWYLKCEKKTELVVYELFELITKKSKWGVVCVCLWVYKVIVQYHLDHDKMKCNITTDLCCKYCPSHSVSLWRGHPQFKLYQNQIFG